MTTGHDKRSLGAKPLLYPEPCLLVGTYDAAGKPNVMLAAWGGICAATPPAVMVAIRPSRWTHDPILQRKAFTVGIATEALRVQADFTGLAAGKDYDKFATAKLTAVRSDLVDAPYPAECPVVLECALMEHLSLGSHTLFLGGIKDVKVDASCLDERGEPDILKIAPLIYDGGGNGYFGIGKRLGDAFSDGKPLLRG